MDTPLFWRCETMQMTKKHKNGQNWTLLCKKMLPNGTICTYMQILWNYVAPNEMGNTSKTAAFKKIRYKKPLANTCLKRSKKSGTNELRTEQYKHSETLTWFEILPKHKHRRTWPKEPRRWGAYCRWLCRTHSSASRMRCPCDAVSLMTLRSKFKIERGKIYTNSPDKTNETKSH